MAHLRKSLGLRHCRLQRERGLVVTIVGQPVPAFAVSVVSISGVFLYGFGRAPSGAAFWRAFRWVFIGVVALQALSHAIEVAGRHKYSAAGTVIFVVFATVLIGWIYLLQWIAMSRLSNEQRS